MMQRQKTLDCGAAWAFRKLLKLSSGNARVIEARADERKVRIQRPKSERLIRFRERIAR